MDNTQLNAKDGSWFLFADWQGVTRISLPGDKVKTDAGLDRPFGTKPLVLRPNGLVWHAYGTDIDPVTLKKVTPAVASQESPDPLGGPDLAIPYDGSSARVGGCDLTFEVRGDELPLGGTSGRRVEVLQVDYDLFPDGSLLVLGRVGGRPAATFVERDEGGGGRIAWCRPVALVPDGAPGAFRRGGRVVLTDRDIVNDVGHLVEIREDGAAVVQQTPAIAGPWVLDGLVWWQPDEHTVCAGEHLGRATKTYDLGEAHAGPGRMLRLTGRALFLPWHGVTLVDLAPVKKGKSEISRRHKAADEPLYREASRLLRPITRAMARRSVRVAWKGVVRSGKRIEPKVEISGRGDLCTEVLAYAMQDGAAAALRGVGATSVSFTGGTIDIKSAAPTMVDDLRELVAALDAAGVNRAAGFGYLPSLAETAAQYELGLPWTRDAELFALAATISGVRDDSPGEIAPANPEGLAAAARRLGDYDAMRKVGISCSGVAQFLALAGFRQFGEQAVAPLFRVLESLNPAFSDNMKKLLGLPFTPYVAPVVAAAPLTPEESGIAAVIESVLGRDFGLDASKCREGRGWYRFHVGELPFQTGIHGADVRVLGTLCATATDVDLGKLGTSLDRANKRGGVARFVEADCYLHAEAQCPRAQADEAKVKSLIEAVRDALGSEAARSLATTYRSFD